MNQGDPFSDAIAGASLALGADRIGRATFIATIASRVSHTVAASEMEGNAPLSPEMIREVVLYAYQAAFHEFLHGDTCGEED